MALPESVAAADQPAKSLTRVQVAGLAWMAVGVTLLLLGGGNTDFDFLWYSARFLAEGSNPYLRAHEVSAWPLYYPLPAVLLAAPFAILPLALARYAWQLVVTGAFAWALAGRGLWAMPALASGAFINAIINGQSTPLIAAAVLVPALGFVLPLKPNSALPAWIAYPSRLAAYGALGILAVSLAIMPRWPIGWWHAIQGGSFLLAPIRRPGGWLLLLAALRWRDPGGRLLLALALVPQNLLLHETVALALVPQTLRQMLLYVAGTWVVLIVSSRLPTPLTTDLNPLIRSLWPWMLGCIYLPMLYLVLRHGRRTPSS